MNKNFQIKVLIGFNLPNYKKLNDRLDSTRKIKIGYDIHPYSIDLFKSDDTSTRRKFDSIYGKINYVTAFLYVEDLIFSASASLCEDRIFKFPNKIVFDALIGEEV